MFFDAVDMGAMNFLLPALTKAFHLTPVQAGLLASMAMAGMLVGSVIAGQLADRVGRKAMIQWSMILWGAAGLLLAASWNFTSLLLFRFLLGLGLGAEYPVANAMVPEFLPKRARGRYLTVMEGLAPVGVICAGIVSYLVLPHVGWRWVFVAEALPAMWLFVVRRSIPESPRWLEARGKKEEAERVTAGIEREVQKRFGKPLPPGISSDFVERSSGTASFWELWSRQYYKRTVMFCILWPATLFGYWAINLWLTTLLVDRGFEVVRSIGYVITITSAGIPGFLSGTYFIERIGRRPLLLCSLLGTAACAYFYGQAPTLTLVIVWGLVMQFFMWNMWPAIYAFTPELYY